MNVTLKKQQQQKKNNKNKKQTKKTPTRRENLATATGVAEQSLQTCHV